MFFCEQRKSGGIVVVEAKRRNCRTRLVHIRKRKRGDMIRFHKHSMEAVALLVLVPALVSCCWAAKGQTGGTGNNQEANPQAQAAGAGNKWQEGTACVKNNAPKCPSQFRGVCRTGRADGCSHDACTSAKNTARANLRAAVPEACYPYIESTSPCKNGPGCRAATKSKGGK